MVAEGATGGSPPAPAGIFAFTEPLGGWSGTVANSAQLTDQQGALLGPSTVAGTIVAAGVEIGDVGPITADVFSEPDDGWVGAIHESATLVAPVKGSGTRGGPLVASSGSTVFTSDGRAVFAFDRPPTGWTGTLSPSATLKTTSRAAFASIAASGRSLIARSRNAVYVFTEPAAGWSGNISPAAILTPSTAAAAIYGVVADTVAIAGGTIAAVASAPARGSRAAVYLFQRARRGWAPHQHEAAILTYPFADETLLPDVAVGQHLVAVETAHAGPDHECPCFTSIYLGPEPRGGWSGTVRLDRSAGVRVTNGPDIAIHAGTIFVAAGDGIHVFATNERVR